MVKIGFVIESFIFSGGVERFLSNLSTSLPKEYEQYIIVIYDAKEFSNTRIVRQWEHNAKNIINLKFKIKNKIEMLFLKKSRADKLLKIKKELKLDFCISCGYYSNDLNIMSNSFAKTIVTIHAFENNFLGKRRYKKYSNAYRIVTVSKEIANFLNIHYKIDKKKIQTIYNLFDVKCISNVIPKDNLLNRNKFNMLMVGRLESQKGYGHAIDIMSNIISKGINNINLNIIGEGHLESKLKELVEKKNIINNVNFLGYKENVYEYMKQADVFLMTSLYEGFPMVNVEALACSLPIISVDCKSGPKELLNENETKKINDITKCNCGVLYPEYKMETKFKQINLKDKISNQMVADYIIDLVNDKKTLLEFKENSYKRAMDFDKEIIIKKWVCLLKI